MMLLVALDYRRERDISQMGEGKDENAFRYFVSKLVRGLHFWVDVASLPFVSSIGRRTFRLFLKGLWGFSKSMPRSTQTTYREAKGQCPTFLKTVRAALGAGFLVELKESVMLLWRIVDLNKVS